MYVNKNEQKYLAQMKCYWQFCFDLYTELCKSLQQLHFFINTKMCLRFTFVLHLYFITFIFFSVKTFQTKIKCYRKKLSVKKVCKNISKCDTQHLQKTCSWFLKMLRKMYPLKKKKVPEPTDEFLKTKDCHAKYRLFCLVLFTPLYKIFLMYDYITLISLF